MGRGRGIDGFLMFRFWWWGCWDAGVALDDSSLCALLESRNVLFERTNAFFLISNAWVIKRTSQFVMRGLHCEGGSAVTHEGVRSVFSVIACIRYL